MTSLTVSWMTAPRLALLAPLLTSVVACGSDGEGATLGGTPSASTGDSMGTNSASDTAAADGVDDGVDDGMDDTTAGPVTTTPMTTAADGSSDSTGSTGGGSTDGSCPAGDLGCPCSDNTCVDDNVCVAGVCEAASVCTPDTNEPNDTPPTATVLPDLDDDGDPAAAGGILDHANDQDWFTYQGNDTFSISGNVAPLRNVTADGTLRLCKFLLCPDGLVETEVTCPDNAALAMAPGGMPGCCADEAFAMPDFNCTGTTDDSAQVWIRVDQAGAECVEYSLTYEY